MATKAKKCDNVLRYAGAGSPRVVPLSHSVEDAEKIERYALPPTTGHAQEIAAIVLDAIRESQKWRFLEAMMAAASERGEPTAVASNQDRGTPAPQAMKKRESKIEAREPAVKYFKGVNPIYTAPPSPSPSPAPTPPRAPVAPAEPDLRTRYAKLLAECGDRHLPYSQRIESLDQAKRMHAEHVGNDSTREVADRAKRRALDERIPYERALRIEQECVGSFSLPLPPAHVA